MREQVTFEAAASYMFLIVICFDSKHQHITLLANATNWLRLSDPVFGAW